MEQFKEFLEETECLFNWQLSEFDVSHSKSMLVQFKDRLTEKSAVADTTSWIKWPLQLSYGYELFAENPARAMESAEEAIEEVLNSEDELNVKYRVPFLHIARSTLAFMIVNSSFADEKYIELVDQVSLIKPKSDMTDVEMSGLLAMKVQVLRYYGPDGTEKSLPFVREAIRLNPDEIEWKISLVVSLNRKRHFLKSTVTWEQVEEPVAVIEELLNRPDLADRQSVQCKYYLAVAYHDYSIRKPWNADSKSCTEEVLRLCREFHDKTDFPQFLSFCAERFTESRSASDRSLGMGIIDGLLDKFPSSISLNVTACKVFKRKGDLARAADHAQVALDNGCYGGAWLWLECKTKLKEDFDDVEFFRKVLHKFQTMCRTRTHINASLYYFFIRKDPVNGASHIWQALFEDSNDEDLWKPCFTWYLRSSVRPVEVAYNQIVLALQTHQSRDDFAILNRAKNKITQVTNVDNFQTSRNIVEDILVGSHSKPGNNRYERRHMNEPRRF